MLGITIMVLIQISYFVTLGGTSVRQSARLMLRKVAIPEVLAGFSMKGQKKGKISLKSFHIWKLLVSEYISYFGNCYSLIVGLMLVL